MLSMNRPRMTMSMHLHLACQAVLFPKPQVNSTSESLSVKVALNFVSRLELAFKPFALLPSDSKATVSITITSLSIWFICLGLVDRLYPL
jgi:hypothetical protein